ncbi:MAG: 30S ribosomal protein S27ae [Candidatus Pacearchaeota archaeon]
MPTSFGGTTKEKKGKKPHKNKPTSKKYEKYKAAGEKAKFCPRCGAGIFLAFHKDRLYCGKCHYTEFSSK